MLKRAVRVWWAGSASGQSRMQQLRQMITSLGPLDKPQLGRDAPAEVRRMLQVTRGARSSQPAAMHAWPLHCT